MTAARKIPVDGFRPRCHARRTAFPKVGLVKLRSQSQNKTLPASTSVVKPAARALAGVIRRRRERLKLSLNELARRSRISRQMLTNIERDINIPTAHIIACIADGLGVSYGELNLAVDGWLLRQPACCRACQYACMARGELPWLNWRHGCVRPKK